MPCQIGFALCNIIMSSLDKEDFVTYCLRRSMLAFCLGWTVVMATNGVVLSADRSLAVPPARGLQVWYFAGLASMSVVAVPMNVKHSLYSVPRLGCSSIFTRNFLAGLVRSYVGDPEKCCIVANAAGTNQEAPCLRGFYEFDICVPFGSVWLPSFQKVLCLRSVSP